MKFMIAWKIPPALYKAAIEGHLRKPGDLRRCRSRSPESGRSGLHLQNGCKWSSATCHRCHPIRQAVRQ